MKLFITGFSNSGKTTAFNALTGLNLPAATYPALITADTAPHSGIVKIPDKRIERLSSVYKPKKTTYATVEYVDYPGITSGGNASQNIKVFNLIKDVDAIVHVVRAFEDNSVIHPMETVDPLRDVRAFEAEIILGDLDFAEKRLERIELAAKKGKKKDETDKQLLSKCKNALENEISLRNVLFTDGEKKIMLAYQLLSTLPEIIALNIGEADLKTDKAVRLQKEIEDYFRENSPDTIPLVIALCGKIEMEIAQLPGEEARAFLDDLSIDEPAMHKLCRVSYKALGLISFFTVGEDEVRAWTIKNGTDAQKAAGKIHSDIEKGFIRAEVISYDDFIASDESMVTAKGKGLLRLEGRNYPVKDGDIINFKFNV